MPKVCKCGGSDQVKKGRCILCRRKAVLASYHKKKAEYDSKAKAERDARKIDNMRRIMSYLSANPCVDCGEQNPLRLQFDHVRGQKSFIISHGLYHRRWSAIEAEIEKCDVRCASCHQAKTIIENDRLTWWLSEQGIDHDTARRSWTPLAPDVQRDDSA